MGRKGTAVEGLDLESAARAFARWRRSRHRRARIPEELWGIAVAQAAEHGVNKTSRSLLLNYYGLKKRLDGPTPSQVAMVSSEASDRPRFVEV